MAQEQRLDQRKRILIVGQHFWPESFRINDIADYLVEQNYEVDVLCGLPNYPKGEFIPGYGYFGKRHEAHNGIRIDRVLEIKRGNNSNIRIFLNYISYPFFSLFHIPKLFFRNYDHIFIYQLSPVMMALPGILLGKLKHIPTTMYVLDLWPENLYSVLPVKNKYLRKIASKHSHWYYRNANQLIALSDSMRDILAVVSGKKPDDIAVIPQACEEIYEKKLIDPALRARFSGTFNIVFTGNISPAQSFSTMLDAAEALLEKGLYDIRWVIVGDGMSRKEVEKAVVERQLEKYFIFEGQRPISDMPKYADIASVLVGCLAKSDLLEVTIPAKVISYIAMGKPIVLAMDGEVRDLINVTIGCGFASPAGEARALADNLERIYNMPPYNRTKMGVQAQKYHKQHLSRGSLLGKMNNTISASTRIQ